MGLLDIPNVRGFMAQQETAPVAQNVPDRNKTTPSLPEAKQQVDNKLPAAKTTADAKLTQAIENLNLTQIQETDFYRKGDMIFQITPEGKVSVFGDYPYTEGLGKFHEITRITVDRGIPSESLAMEFKSKLNPDPNARDAFVPDKEGFGRSRPFAALRELSAIKPETPMPEQLEKAGFKKISDGTFQITLAGGDFSDRDTVVILDKDQKIKAIGLKPGSLSGGEIDISNLSVHQAKGSERAWAEINTPHGKQSITSAGVVERQLVHETKLEGSDVSVKFYENSPSIPDGKEYNAEIHLGDKKLEFKKVDAVEGAWGHRPTRIEGTIDGRTYKLNFKYDIKGNPIVSLDMRDTA